MQMHTGVKRRSVRGSTGLKSVNSAVDPTGGPTPVGVADAEAIAASSTAAVVQTTTTATIGAAAAKTQQPKQ